MNHGIMICGVPPNHHYEFWWMGERVDIGEFNTRLADMAESAACNKGWQRQACARPCRR